MRVLSHPQHRPGPLALRLPTLTPPPPLPEPVIRDEAAAAIIRAIEACTLAVNELRERQEKLCWRLDRWMVEREGND